MSKKMLYPFSQREPNERSFTILRHWWRELEDNKGDRAILRRAGSLKEVVFCPGYHRLLWALRKGKYSVPESHLPKLAAIAGLAARIKEDIAGTLGKQLGALKQGDKPTVSELRMRRLLACDDIEELYVLLRRVLGILSGNASLSGLAVTIWQWEPLTEKRPYDSRKQMAFDYYEAASL